MDTFGYGDWPLTDLHASDPAANFTRADTNFYFSLHPWHVEQHCAAVRSMRKGIGKAPQAVLRRAGLEDTGILSFTTHSCGLSKETVCRLISLRAAAPRDAGDCRPLVVRLPVMATSRHCAEPEPSLDTWG